jgi:hypothetical protein
MERTAHSWLSFTLPLQRLFVRIGVLPFLLVIALIVFTGLSDRFLTSENLITVARQTTYLAIVAMGQMLAHDRRVRPVRRQDRGNHISDYWALTMAPLSPERVEAIAGGPSDSLYVPIASAGDQALRSAPSADKRSSNSKADTARSKVGHHGRSRELSRVLQARD